MKDIDNMSIKSRSIKYNSGKKMRPKKILEAKFEARPIFEARPKFGLRPKKRPSQLWGQARPGQANGARPGFIVCRPSAVHFLF